MRDFYDRFDVHIVHMNKKGSWKDHIRDEPIL